jgi:hypothetical protein
VRNPFPRAARVGLELAVRRGAFEVAGLPAELPLGPGEEASLSLRLVGGSWGLGGDPLIVARYRFPRARGAAARELVLDAPLERRRVLRLGRSTRRVELVRERPADPPATMALSRIGQRVLVAIENPGGLLEARTLAHVDGQVLRGGRSLRVRLPDDCDRRPGGLPFSVGLAGVRAAERGLVVRRWAGGLPDALEGGAPGRLLPGG